MLVQFQFENPVARIKTKVRAAGFHDGRPADMRADELMNSDDAASSDMRAGHSDHFPMTVIRWTGRLFQRKACTLFQSRAASAIILRELANCLYEDRNCFASAGQRPPAANPGM